jgi:tRNA dimethylallyltransferase
VTIGSERPFSSFGPGIDAYPPTRFRIAGLWLPRPVVAARIATRFDSMMAEGLVEEVRRLAKSPTGLSRTARQALGYREILAHLEQEQDTNLDDNVAQAVRRTRAFARRQRVWWRRDPRITWFGASENPLAVMPALLRDWTNA